MVIGLISVLFLLFLTLGVPILISINPEGTIQIFNPFKALVIFILMFVVDAFIIPFLFGNTGILPKLLGDFGFYISFLITLMLFIGTFAIPVMTIIEPEVLMEAVQNVKI